MHLPLQWCSPISFPLLPPLPTQRDDRHSLCHTSSAFTIRGTQHHPDRPRNREGSLIPIHLHLWHELPGHDRCDPILDSSASHESVLVTCYATQVSFRIRATAFQYTEWPLCLRADHAAPAIPRETAARESMTSLQLEPTDFDSMFGLGSGPDPELNFNKLATADAVTQNCSRVQIQSCWSAPLSVPHQCGCTSRVWALPRELIDMSQTLQCCKLLPVWAMECTLTAQCGQSILIFLSMPHMLPFPMLSAYVISDPLPAEAILVICEQTRQVRWPEVSDTLLHEVQLKVRVASIDEVMVNTLQSRLRESGF